MKTLKDLAKALTSKESGYNYTYTINGTIHSIDEFNDCKGWCYNQYSVNGSLLDSYGYNGLTLKECKLMILASWNEQITNQIKETEKQVSKVCN
jgi:hypothetical protein